MLRNVSFHSFHHLSFSHPPCSRVQKWHLFSQTTPLHPFYFFHQVVVSNSVQRHVSNFAWWTASTAYWKNMDFSTFSPLCNVLLPVPSSTHVLSLKELGHCASKFEQTNSHVEIVHPNKLQTVVCPAVVYLLCLYAACGEEVYTTPSERHQTKWTPKARWREKQPSLQVALSLKRMKCADNRLH